MFFFLSEPGGCAAGVSIYRSFIIFFLIFINFFYFNFFIFYFLFFYYFVNYLLFLFLIFLSCLIFYFLILCFMILHFYYFYFSFIFFFLIIFNFLNFLCLPECVLLCPRFNGSVKLFTGSTTSSTIFYRKFLENSENRYGIHLKENFILSNF